MHVPLAAWWQVWDERGVVHWGLGDARSIFLALSLWVPSRKEKGLRACLVAQLAVTAGSCCSSSK